MNHVVLNVGDVEATVNFYRDVLDFSLIIESPKNRYAFLRAPGSENHHDLALFSVKDDPDGAEKRRASYGGGRVGLHHVAWQAGSLDELEEYRARFEKAGCLISVMDHGTNKSVYGVDPDGLDVEIMWLVPQELWGEMEHVAIAELMDLDAERVKYAALVAD
ncbi:VOC family protein [Nocardioides marmoriginsengisoli]|uniref:VOC family protein n=1 Tax=Nocardioides marmoriginsengisoli TaxID=661483 RepID=A0A3N0CHI0_9ACTN|nr:VOC family protein [Nocardioides marmoriginsengisoli]